MKDLLLGFKLIKYGERHSTYAKVAVIYFAIGMLFEFLYKGANPIGLIYLAIISGMIIGSALTIENADYFLASPKMKKLQTIVPAFMYLVFLTIAFVISTIMKIIFIKLGMTDYNTAGLSLLLASVFIVFTMLYYSISYKYMVVATIIFMIFMIPYLILIMNQTIMEKMVSFDYSLAFLPTVLISYGVVLISIVIYYLVARALYKKPFSKYAFRGYMQGRK